MIDVKDVLVDFISLAEGEIKRINIGPLNGATLLSWRERMGYNQRDAAKILGCSRGAWGKWESGEQRIPRYIGLACAALAFGFDPYGMRDALPQWEATVRQAKELLADQKPLDVERFLG